MLMWASLIVADFINELVAFNTFKKLNNIHKKIEIRDIVILFLLAIISAILIITVKSSLNFFIKLFCVMYGFKYLTQSLLPKSIITIIVIYIIFAIS